MRTQRRENSPVAEIARISQPTEISTNYTTHYLHQYRPKRQPKDLNPTKHNDNREVEGNPISACCQEPRSAIFWGISARPGDARKAGPSGGGEEEREHFGVSLQRSQI